MKVAEVYLDLKNYGDQVIYRTCDHLVRTILGDLGIKAEIVPVDMGSNKARSHARELGASARLGALFGNGVRRLLRFRLIRKIVPKKLSMRLLRKAFRRTIECRWFYSHEKEKLKNADLIVFCGGGLIKFHRQNLHYFVDDITRYAVKHKIPVIMNAVGIEGYDPGDPECMILKEALNRNCFRMITTRDDIKSLTGDYIVNPRIETAAVCDPAFWVRETFGTERSSGADISGARRIGLNIIRPDIFREYMYPVSAGEIGRLYDGLIRELTGRGFQAELFSNGTPADNEFAEWFYSVYPGYRETVPFTVPENTEDFVRLIAGYDRLVAARLHSAIIATALGIPSISLVWNRKQLLFAGQVGKTEDYFRREDWDAGRMAEALLAAVPYQGGSAYKESVKSKLKEGILSAVLRKQEREA